MAKRVLFLHCSDGGYGADRQLLHLIRGLDRSRFEPLVVLPAHGPLEQELEALGSAAVKVHPLALLRRDLLRRRGLAATVGRLGRDRRALGSLARSAGVEIVHSNSSIVLSGQAVAAAAGAAHVMHVREIWPGGDGRLERRLWPVLQRRILRADAVLCVSAAAAGPFVRAERVRVVRDGVSAPARLPERAAARRALGIPADAFVAAAVGRLSDWKGQDVLAHALVVPELRDLGAVALVAGDAAPGQERFRHELQQLADTLGLDGRFRLLGYREDVATLRAAADVEVVSSRRPDALPNSALEAAVAGLPLVATRAGGQPEIVRDGVTGQLVGPGDPLALARALGGVAANPEWARRLGDAAAADVSRRFTVARMVEEVQACYEAL